MSIPIQQCVFLLSAISKKEYLRTILSIERTDFFYKYTYFIIKVIYTIMGWPFLWI